MSCGNPDNLIEDHMDEFKDIIDQIKTITLSVEEHTYKELQKKAYDLLWKLHDAGYTKDEVYQSLLTYQAILKDGLSYDFLCDLMDYVVGWCATELQIWKNDTLKDFYDYLSSEDELMYDIRMHAEWNETSFSILKQLVYAIMQEYKDKTYYPERLISYMQDIPTIIHMLSHFQQCSQENIEAGYTQETYKQMIIHRIEELTQLYEQFMKSLNEKNTQNQDGKES